jgi:hypothetical protein
MIPYYVMITHTGELVDTEVLNNVLMRAEMKDRSTHDETATFDEGWSERKLSLHDTVMHWPETGGPPQETGITQQVSGTSVGTLPSFTSSDGGFPNSAATLLNHQLGTSSGFLFPSAHHEEGKDQKSIPEPSDECADEKFTMAGNLDESDKVSEPVQLSMANVVQAPAVRFAMDDPAAVVQPTDSAGCVVLTPPGSPSMVSPTLKPKQDGGMESPAQPHVTVNMDNIITKGNSGDVARQMQNIAAGLRNIGGWRVECL